MLLRLGLTTDPLYHSLEMTKYDNAYAVTANLFGEAPERILVDHSALIEDGGSILDVGCGQGRNTLWLAKKGFEVVALDPSAIALGIVNDVAATSKLKITTIHGGFENLRVRARITSAFRIPSAPHLRFELNHEILNVARATPRISLNPSNQI